MPSIEPTFSWVYTEANFAEMGWHDCTIHAFSISDPLELVLDIDYLVRWEQPASDGEPFNFWIAPSTLVFWNVYDVIFDIESVGGALMEIDYIKRTALGAPRNQEFIDRDVEWLWDVELHTGLIQFKSAGFYQYLRTRPILRTKYVLPYEDRGGINFSRKICELKSEK